MSWRHRYRELGERGKGDEKQVHPRHSVQAQLSHNPSSATVPHVQNRESGAREVKGHRTLTHAQLGGLQVPSSLKPAGFQLDAADLSSWKTTRANGSF